MPAYWMISNRAVGKDGFGTTRAPVSYWISDKGPLDRELHGELRAHRWDRTPKKWSQ